MSEGAEQKVIDEKHLNIRLPKVLFGGETSEVMDVAYAEWKEAIPSLRLSQRKRRRQGHI